MQIAFPCAYKEIHLTVHTAQLLAQKEKAARLQDEFTFAQFQPVQMSSSLVHKKFHHIGHKKFHHIGQMVSPIAHSVLKLKSSEQSDRARNLKFYSLCSR